MEILLQLGANETAFIQFILFVITITFLTTVVYGPFFKAYDERHKRTKGADQVAFETQDEAKKLSQIYQARAREINDKISKVFEVSKTEASKTVTHIVEDAKLESNKTVEAARKQIDSQKLEAKAQAKNIAQDVSGEIIKKIMGTV